MGTIGQPKFKREDTVSFAITVDGEKMILNGVVYIVDAYGTFEQDEEPSYDIEALYNGEVSLFKHIRESKVEARTV